jgi:lipopolysaccharide biosynthesis regulator YciM
MDPELSSAALLSGDLAAEAGDYNDAIECHRSAWDLSHHLPEVAVRLSSDLLSAGRIDEAEKLLLRASESEGGHPVILRRLRDLYADSRRWEEARTMAVKLSRLNATPSERKEDKRKENRLILAAAEAKLADSDGKGATAMFEDAARRLPSEVGPRLRLGDVYLAENRGKRAVKTWETGYRELGKHDFLRRLVSYYKQHGKGNLQAATAIVSVGRARPSDPVPAVMAAALYFEEGQAKEAIRILRSASASTGSIGDVDAEWFDLVRNLLEARGKLEEGDRLAAENDLLSVAGEAGRKILGDSPGGVVFAPLNGSAGSENCLDG